MQSIDPLNEFEQSLNQDETTANALYDNYVGLVYSFAYRITQDADLAARTTEKVFITLWRVPALTGDETRNFPGQLLTLTRKFSLEALKGDWQAELSFEDIPDWQEKRDELSGSLLPLNEADRELLMWIYFDGLSQYDIAKRLNIPNASVPNRIREAFSQLDPTSEQLKRKKTCLFSKKLADYFSFQLQPIEASGFEQHLALCSKCQAEFREWQRLTEDFPYLSELQAPPDQMKEQILTTGMEHHKSNGAADLQIAHKNDSMLPATTKWLPLLAAALIVSVGANTFLATSKLKQRKPKKRRRNHVKKV